MSNSHMPNLRLTLSNFFLKLADKLYDRKLCNSTVCTPIVIQSCQAVSKETNSDLEHAVKIKSDMMRENIAKEAANAVEILQEHDPMYDAVRLTGRLVIIKDL